MDSRLHMIFITVLLSLPAFLITTDGLAPVQTTQEHLFLNSERNGPFETQERRVAIQKHVKPLYEHHHQQNDFKRAITSMGPVVLLMTATNLFFSIQNSFAAEEIPPSFVSSSATTTAYSIEKCDPSIKSPCISTSNVRQLNLYSPPWTYNANADEVLARLKGAVAADPLNTIVSYEKTQSGENNDNSWRLLVDSTRKEHLLGAIIDRLEFVINEKDSVVTFRSSAPLDSTVPDFGLQKKRLTEIRERAGIFGVMGESLNTADTKTTGEKGNGPLGQLKAFYGLQSGGGFEDVLSE